MPATTTRDTKQQILDLAEAMMQRQGFNGFSYQHLSDRLGIKNAAIHYHFRSKSDLGRAIIEAYRERLHAWAKARTAEGATPVDMLDGYIAMMRMFLQCDEGGKICPGGILAAEFNAIPEEMRAPTLQLLEEVHEWLARVLSGGRKQGLFHFRGSASDRALAVGAAVQGAVQIGRARGVEYFDRAVSNVRADLEV